MADCRENYTNIMFLTLAVLFVPALSIQSRSVNLALETSFLFDPHDIKENATFINKVQNVLDKLKTVLEPPPTVFRGKNGHGDDKVILTRFLSQIGSYLLKFDNNDIKKMTSDLRDAVYMHADKNKEFNELFEDVRLRAFIKNTVKIWAETDPMVLKVEIAKYITSIDTDAVIELFRILNKVFDSTADEAKLKKLTKKFTKAIKHKDFTKFLSKTIDFVVFKRFNKLNFLLKQIIKDELKKFAEYVSKEYKDRIDDTTDDSFSLSNTARGERIPYAKYSSESNEITTLKTNRAKNSDAKQDEIVIDKDLDLDVRTNDNNGLMLNMN